MELSADARAAFDAMREGVTIIDTNGIIVFGNRAYREFLNKEAGGDIGPIEGYRLRDLRPGARLPDVLEAGKPILHLTRQEIKDFYFVNMYPIYQDGVLIGGLSVVTFLDDAYQARADVYKRQVRGLYRRLRRAGRCACRTGCRRACRSPGRVSHPGSEGGRGGGRQGRSGARRRPPGAGGPAAHPRLGPGGPGV